MTEIYKRFWLRGGALKERDHIKELCVEGRVEG
jgi:hypothetical protein